MGRTEGAKGAAVGRDEHERVCRLRLNERFAAHRCVRARELDQRTGAGRIVVCAPAFAAVVAVRGDHDRALRGAAHDRDEILQLDFAPARDLRGEALHPRWLEAVELELLRHPAGRAESSGRPG